MAADHALVPPRTVMDNFGDLHKAEKEGFAVLACGWFS